MEIGDIPEEGSEVLPHPLVALDELSTPSRRFIVIVRGKAGDGRLQIVAGSLLAPLQAFWWSPTPV